MSDRGLQSVLLSAIQREFGVSDVTIGALQGLAGVLVASAIAVPIARLADKYARKSVLLGLIAGWTLLMMLSALAPNFPLFFIGRAASGVTEFAMIPIVYSMIPDLSPERHRVAANLSFAALMAAGASAGFYYGEDIVLLANALLDVPAEPWRRAMLLLSFAGPPLLLLGVLTVDPARSITADDQRSSDSLIGFLRARWRAVGLFVDVAGSLMIAVQALNPLIALALERRFDARMSVIGAGRGHAGCQPRLPARGGLSRQAAAQSPGPGGPSAHHGAGRDRRLALRPVAAGRG